MLLNPQNIRIYILYSLDGKAIAHIYNDIKFYSCAAALFFSLTCGLGGGVLYIAAIVRTRSFLYMYICRYGGTNGPCLARRCHGYISIFLFFFFIPLLSVAYTYEKLCPCIIAAAVHTQQSAAELYTAAGWIQQ